MVEEKIHPRLRDQDGQLFQELDRGEHERARAVCPRVRERHADTAIGEELDSLLRERRAQEVVRQALEPRTVIGTHRPARVQIEGRVARMPRRLGFGRVHVGIVPDARNARARGAAEDAAPGDGRGAERGERGRVLGEGIPRVRVRLVEREAVAREDALDPARDRATSRASSRGAGGGAGTKRQS